MDNHKSTMSSSEQAISSSISSALQSNIIESHAISFLENAPICIKVLDLDFNLKYMSPAGIKALQIDDITNFYNKPYPFSFYPQSICDTTTKNLNKAVRNNEIVKQEVSAIDSEGNKLAYRSTIIPVESEIGQNESILIICIESTLNKKADFELLNLRKVQENIGVLPLIEHSNQNVDISFMAKVTKIILANIDDNNFDVTVLAKKLFMSRSTLQRKIAKESGVSAALFIRGIRLSKAHELIKSNVHKTLAETAYSVGFNHPGHFSKLYKKYLLTI